MKDRSNAPDWRAILLVGLSLSIGWGIRGNFGHEYGAAIPGAMAAMALALVSGRADWQRRTAFFGFFGAAGWALGGSISYMQVIAYTHSGHSLSVWYGFTCLFVIGFLWAAVGGGAVALPALLNRERLTEFFPPLIAIFAVWFARDVAVSHLIHVDSAFRQNDPLYWYDTSWTSALAAVVAVLGLALIRRRLDSASKLLLCMGIGWWAGFLILVVGLGIRMTPPRGDNWAGCIGAVIGMLIYFQRNGLRAATHAALVTGTIGGIGFAVATMFKLAELKTGWETNYHSILEQTYGLINGIGLAVGMAWLTARSPKVSDEEPIRPWTEAVAVGFLLIVLTYMNIQKDVDDWMKAKAVPAAFYGLSAHAWFDLAYLGIAGLAVWLYWLHRKGKPLPIPESWDARGQLLYLAFLWWMVIGNLFKAIVAFAPQRIVTEGTIGLNALICTGLVIAWTRSDREPDSESSDRPPIKRAILGLAATLLIVPAVSWGIVRGLYGDKFAGNAGLHIRFGPHMTATDKKPDKSKPHP